MNVTATPAPKSSVILEVEVPPERSTGPSARPSGASRSGPGSPASGPARRRAASSRRVLGHGAVLDEAVDHLVQSAYRDALIEQEILPLTNADVEVVQAEEGKPLIFKATVQVRPEVELGDYRNFNFKPEIETDRRRQGRQGHRGAARPERDPRAGRGPRRAERRLRGHRLRGHAATASPFEGGSAERMPLIIGEERLIPGFEANLVGLDGRRDEGLRHHVPRRLHARRRSPASRPTSRSS